MKNVFESTRDVIIRTRKWSEAVQFYRSTLGFKMTHRGSSLAGFSTGPLILYIEKGKNHGPVFEFLVQDVQAAKKKLVKAGCKVIEEDPSVPRCYIKDPYGLVFNIGQK